VVKRDGEQNNGSRRTSSAVGLPSRSTRGTAGTRSSRPCSWWMTRGRRHRMSKNWRNWCGERPRPTAGLSWVFPPQTAENWCC
jgi:hypothetical protein